MVFHSRMTMSFFDNISIKGCEKSEKDKTVDRNGCRKFG